MVLQKEDWTPEIWEDYYEQKKMEEIQDRELDYYSDEDDDEIEGDKE